jgi:hypothetical protein
MKRELLANAKEEILELRRQNEIYRAQIFGRVLGFQPVQRGETIDIAWELQREIDRLKQEAADA